LREQSAANLPVSLAVAINLCRPVDLICFGDMTTFPATVPKATVDKDCQTLALKKEVRPARYVFAMFRPTRDTRLN